VFLIALIAFGANLTSILEWMDVKPTPSFPSFTYTLSCNNNSPSPFGAQVDELEHLSTFLGFIASHDGEVVQVSFELSNDGAGTCVRLDEEEVLVPDYDVFAGMISVAEYSVGNNNQGYIRAVSPEFVLQIDAFWPDEFAVQQTIMLPQVRELLGRSGYSTGDKYCTRCFSGIFEAHYLPIPAGELYTLKTPNK